MLKLKRLIILYLMITLFSISFVNADTLDNAKASYTLDSVTTDSTGVYNLTAFGSPTAGSTNCILNDCYFFDNTDDYMSPSYQIPSSTSSYSISMWVYRTTSANTDAFIGQTDSDSGKPAGLIYTISGSNTVYFTHAGAGTASGGSLPVNTLTHVVMTFDGSTIKGYIDGTQIATTGGVATAISTNSLTIGRYGSHDNHYANAYIDQVIVYDRTLNTSEISSLYNGGSGLDPYAAAPPSAGITIDDISLVNNSYHNSNIPIQLNLSVTDTNENVNSSYSLNGGTFVQFGTNTLQPNITLSSLSNQEYNITFKVQNNETQTNSSQYTFTFDNINPSVVYASNETEFNTYSINMSNLFNVTDTNLDTCTINITDYENVTNPDTSTINCTDTFAFVHAGLHQLAVNATDLAGNYNDTTIVNISVNPLILVFFNDVNGTTITNYTSTIYHPDGRIEPGVINDDGGTILSPVNNGSLDLGLHYITFDSFGYLLQNVSVIVNETNAGRNETFNVTNSRVDIFVRDKSTQALVSGPLFNLEIIGPVGFVTNTSNGTSSITRTLMIPGNYELVVSNSNYSTETLKFSFNNKEVINLTVFVNELNATSSGQVIVKCVDKFGAAVVGATTEALQWDSSTSTYERVSQSKITEDGQSILNIILDTEQYIFGCSFEQFATNSTPQFIAEAQNGKEITLRLSPGQTTEFSLFEDIFWNVTEAFNITTRISDIDFTWRTGSGRDVQGCIIYYRLYNNGQKIELDRECDTSSSVVLMSNKAINSSYDVLASIGFIQDSIFFEVDYYTYYGDVSMPVILQDLNFHYYVLPFLFIIVVVVGMSQPYLGGVGIMLAGGSGIYLAPTFITKTIVAFFIFLGFVIIIGGNKKK